MSHTRWFKITNMVGLSVSTKTTMFVSNTRNQKTDHFCVIVPLTCLEKPKTNQKQDHFVWWISCRLELVRIWKHMNQTRPTQSTRKLLPPYLALCVLFCIEVQPAVETQCSPSSDQAKPGALPWLGMCTPQIKQCITASCPPSTSPALLQLPQLSWAGPEAELYDPPDAAPPPRY